MPSVRLADLHHTAAVMLDLDVVFSKVEFPVHTLPMSLHLAGSPRLTIPTTDQLLLLKGDF